MTHYPSGKELEEEEDGPVTMINVGLLHHDVFVSRAFLHSNLDDNAKKKISNLTSTESYIVVGPSMLPQGGWLGKIPNHYL